MTYRATILFIIPSSTIEHAWIVLTLVMDSSQFQLWGKAGQAKGMSTGEVIVSQAGGENEQPS